MRSAYSGGRLGHLLQGGQASRAEAHRGGQSAAEPGTVAQREAETRGCMGLGGETALAFAYSVRTSQSSSQGRGREREPVDQNFPGNEYQTHSELEVSS